MKIIFGVLSLIYFFNIFCFFEEVHAETIQQEKNIMAPEIMKQKGKHLRDNIEDEYNRLKVSKTLSLPNTGKGNDISQIILKYIPIGTSFEDAEIVLQSAGFSLATSPPRPARSLDPSYDRFNIRGGLTLEEMGFGRVDVVIILYAETPGVAHTTVKKVYCSIKTSSL
jgi:hypothetical protein